MIHKDDKNNILNLFNAMQLNEALKVDINYKKYKKRELLLEKYKEKKYPLHFHKILELMQQLLIR